MLVLEFGKIIHVIVDNDVEIVRLVVGRNVRHRERLGHVEVELSIILRVL